MMITNIVITVLTTFEMEIVTMIISGWMRIVENLVNFVGVSSKILRCKITDKYIKCPK